MDSDIGLTTDYRYVPSLVALCIRRLALYPDQISGVALTYTPPPDSSKFDILKALIPTYNEESFALSAVDPRLWATLVQIYSTTLPEELRTYPISLADTRLPLLQCIPSTSSFSFITILELPGCPHFTDDSLTAIKPLHNLIAIDASETKISAWGLKKLLMPALSLNQVAEESDSLSNAGPLGLRILRLRNCNAIDNTIFSSLQKLLLLSVIDLRGTACDPSSIPVPYKEWSSTALQQSRSSSLYHPTPLIQSVDSLGKHSGTVYSSPNIFQLHVNSLRLHPIEDDVISGFRKQEVRPGAPAVKVEDQAFTFTSNTILPHPPQVDQYMLSVAEKEARESANRLKSRRFYRPVGRLCAPSMGYSPERHYTEFCQKEERKALLLRHNASWSGWERTKKKRRVPVPPRDTLIDPESLSLMLYRPPPPWCSIENLIPAEIQPSKSKQSSISRPTVVTNATTKVDKARIRMIADFKAGVVAAARNRTSGNMMPSFDGPNPNSDESNKLSNKEVSEPVQSMLQGRNPFRNSTTATTVDKPVLTSKNNPAGSMSMEPRDRGKGTQTKSTITTQPERPPPSPKLKRPLKPISSVHVPELPPEEMKKLKESMMKKPRTSLPSGSSSSVADRSYDSSRRKSLPPRKDGNIKELIQRTTEISVPHRRKVEEAMELAHIQTEQDFTGPKTLTKTKGKIGFDWKSWGTS
ncbi:hypothetical protein F5880DRAFT_1533801 [Lentinula raphanica]|nr:hypothetical protein F5880DRAFT_1533801 [Lentinula raphanica]